MGYNEVNKNSDFHWSLSQENSNSVATVEHYNRQVQGLDRASCTQRHWQLNPRGQWQSSSTHSAFLIPKPQKIRRKQFRERAHQPLQRPQLARLPERIQVIVSYAATCNPDIKCCGNRHISFKILILSSYISSNQGQMSPTLVERAGFLIHLRSTVLLFPSN